MEKMLVSKVTNFTYRMVIIFSTDTENATIDQF